MNSENYLDNLQRIQKQYKQLNARIAQGEGACTREMAHLHVEAVKLCEELMEKTEGTDNRWRTRRDYHAQEAERMIRHLQEKKAVEGGTSKAAPAGSQPEESQIDDKMVQGWFKPAPKHSFNDVSGMEEIKEKLRKFAGTARKQGLFKVLDMDSISSFLFYGPPGSGKTYIIEAFVHELMQDDYKYISVDAADILGKYQGESEKRVKAIFQAAEENAPCILFIDEIDNLCPDRNTRDLPAHKISLLESFLTAYNHARESGKDVFFMAATNFPQKIDSAMFSRMRMERIMLPDREAKIHFLSFKFAKASITLDADISCESMVRDLEKCSYRDIDALITNIKLELIDITEKLHMDEKAAVDAIASGSIRLNKAVYEKALREIIFTPVDKYLKELGAWEEQMGIA